jgi:hypothetical protein
MNHWEYKVLSVNTLHNEPTVVEFLTSNDFGSERIEEVLNSMGRDGWELVAFVSAQPTGYMWKAPAVEEGSWVDANPWLYRAIFKRQAR